MGAFTHHRSVIERLGFPQRRIADSCLRARKIVGHAGAPRNTPVPAVPVDHAQLRVDPNSIAPEYRPIAPGAQSVSGGADGCRPVAPHERRPVVRPTRYPHERMLLTDDCSEVSEWVQTRCPWQRLTSEMWADSPMIDLMFPRSSREKEEVDMEPAMLGEESGDANMIGHQSNRHRPPGPPA